MKIGLALAIGLLPALVLLAILWRTRTPRWPVWLTLGLFLLGSLVSLLATVVVVALARWLGFELGETNNRGASAFVFLFGLLAPLTETFKASATWPMLRAKRFGQAYDGLLVPAVASLGYGALQSCLLVGFRGDANLLGLRALLALLAQPLFVAPWGYALGRARRTGDGARWFFPAWLLATVSHGLYVYLVGARGESALLGVLPILLTLLVLFVLGARDLRQHPDAPSPPPHSLAPPRTLGEVRRALSRAEGRLRVRWVLLATLASLGAALLGFALAVWFGHVAHVDFASFDEEDVRTAAPVALLAAGILGAFPVAGWLVAKASDALTILESALGAALAIVLGLLAFASFGPMAVVFGFACSPVAWALACAGAWLGRSRPRHA